MEGEKGEEQEAYIQANIQLPHEQVHQSRSNGSGYAVAKTSGKAGKP
jgi:hypothetical protein